MASTTIKEPLIIYRDILIPLLKASGFKLDYDASDDKRYHTRFVWSSSYVDTDIKSPHYGQTRSFESKVDVVGIPMGYSFLILHGVVIGGLADDCDDVKLKIRCAPRTKSLSQSSTDSSAQQQLVMNRANSLNNENPNANPESAEDYQARIRLELLNEFVYKLIEMFSLRLDDLPLELKLKIMGLLPLKSIVALSRVSTGWRELSLDEQLWRLMVKKFFPDIFARREPGQSWKALFKDEFRRQRVFEKRRAFAAARHPTGGFLPALPPSPPLLPIAPPPFYPMLPPPPNFIRELFPQRPAGPFVDNPFWDDDIQHHPGGINVPRPARGPPGAGGPFHPYP